MESLGCPGAIKKGSLEPMETFQNWVISLIVLGFFGFVLFSYGFAMFEAWKESKAPKVKVHGRRGWFN